VIQPAHKALAVVALRERAERMKVAALAAAETDRVRATSLLDLARDCSRAADEIQREITHD
jgi:hypothetical protein